MDQLQDIEGRIQIVSFGITDSEIKYFARVLKVSYEEHLDK